MKREKNERFPRARTTNIYWIFISFLWKIQLIVGEWHCDFRTFLCKAWNWNADEKKTHSSDSKHVYIFIEIKFHFHFSCACFGVFSTSFPMKTIFQSHKMQYRIRKRMSEKSEWFDCWTVMQLYLIEKRFPVKTVFVNVTEIYCNL